MRALLLCAGAGTRMRPLTYVVPKPLVEVAGVPMAVRQLLALRRAGITDVVVNAAHQSELLQAALGDGAAWGVRLHWSVEGRTAEEALETRGGIVRALDLLTADGDEAFLVVAGDIVTDYPYERLVQAGEGLSEERAAHLVLVSNPVYHPKGDMRLENGWVCRDAQTHTFSSLGAYRASLFAGLPDEKAGLFPWLFEFCAQGRVSGEVYEGFWRNVGDFRELAAAQKALGRQPNAWPRAVKA